MTVARKSSSTLELLNANPVIDGLGVLLGQTFSKTIELRLSLEPGLPAIMADRNQIEQALLNLCVNARDAMPEGGRLVLKTWSVPGESVRHPDANADKRYVCVEVTDTGMGMDESVQKRIFEPFFTTKEIGQGTGLGLSVVYGIVRHHDGFIDVESRPMSGTSFRLYFPVYHSQRSAEKPSVNFDTNAKAASNTAATVLIVEDEKNIVYAMERILQKRGYKVMVASDGEMAVEIYRRDKEKIDVVLLDMGLPKLTGRDVLRAIKDENPAVKVIVASGYIEPELESEIERYGAKFLHKPYMLDEVFNKIQGFVEEAG